MYDRTVKPIPKPTTSGIRYRIETLIGITGAKMAKYRTSWTESICSPFIVVWRPHLLMILWFEVCADLQPLKTCLIYLGIHKAMIFGFSIGINVCLTDTRSIGSPPTIIFLYRLRTRSSSARLLL